MHGGTLVVTDRRLLELRAHLDVHGASNVRECKGCAVRRQLDRTDNRYVVHRLVPPEKGGPKLLEDTLLVETVRRAEASPVSKGPEATPCPEDFGALRDAILRHAM